MLKQPDRTEKRGIAAMQIGLGVCALAAGAGPLVWGLNGWGLSVLFAGSLLGGWMLAATALTFLASRNILLEAPDWPDEPRAGASFRVRARIVNAGRKMPNLYLKIGWRVDVQGAWCDVSAHRLRLLAPAGEVELLWELRPGRRGTHYIDSILATVIFPGSLAKVVHTFDQPVKYRARHVKGGRSGGWETSVHFRRARLIVLPTLYRLQPWTLDILAGRRAQSARTRSHSTGLTEFVGVRNYRAGDNPRLVHWALSFRLAGFPGNLVTREFEDPLEDDVCLILETATEKNSESLESALCFALALCRLLLEHQFHVRFLAYDGASGLIDCALGEHRNDMHRLESELADLAAAPGKRSEPLVRELAYRTRSTILWIASTEPAGPLPPSVIRLDSSRQKQLIREVVGA
jgi:uncharacterized protein (DUF58 family)